MSSTSLPDPFVTTLDHLRGTLSDFAPLVSPIDSIAGVIGSIDKLLNTIGELILAFRGVDELVAGLGALLDFLTPIPIVGEIADVISGIIETAAEGMADVLALATQINTDVIKPVSEVLHEIATGLAEARTVVVDLGQKVPGYINTVEILHYLSQIATPIVGVLQGTKPADDLAAVLRGFDTIQAEVGKALALLDPGIRAVETGITTLTGVFDTVMAEMGHAGHDALAAIEGAVGFLRPISDGFNRLVDAIKPLKWVLDAVACIFNKVLKPVIDAILRATGLQALVNRAEAEVFEKLGIAPVLNLAQSSLGGGSIDQTSDQLGPGKGAGTTALWGATVAALGQYRSGDSAATKTAILTVLGAITQTPIDPGKPGKAPPFPPNLPDLTAVPETGAGTGIMGQYIPGPYVPRRVTRIDAAVLARLKAPRTRPALRSLLAAVPGLTDDLPKIDPKDWPNTAALVADIEALTPELDKLVPEAVTLETALAAMDGALRLPATFAHQAADLQALLGDAVHILGVLDSFDIGFVQTLVKPFKEVATDQNTKMQAVTAALPALSQAIAELDTATMGVIAAFPNAALVEEALRRIEGWRLSLGQTIALLRAARIKDAAVGNANKAEIDALAAQIEASAADLHRRLAAITDHCRQIGTSVAAVRGGIGTCAGMLAGITAHSILLSDKALPVADQAVHVLGLVNSIVDPLAGIFHLLGDPTARLAASPNAAPLGPACPDADTLIKLYGASAVAALQRLAQADLDTPQTFAHFAQALATQALPLTDMAQAVASAATTLSTDAVHAFTANAADLAQGLTGLAAELAETRTYSTTITTRTGDRQEITVQNDIMDNTMVAQAQTLLAALGFAARKG